LLINLYGGSQVSNWAKENRFAVKTVSRRYKYFNKATDKQTLSFPEVYSGVSPFSCLPLGRLQVPLRFLTSMVLILQG